MSPKHLLMISHGSRSKRWQQTFERICASLQESLGQEQVSLCYMEIAKPGLLDAIQVAYEQFQKKEFEVLPMFMAGGGHVDQDIPKQIEQAREAFPDISINMLGPVGEDPRFYKMIEQIVKESL